MKKKSFLARRVKKETRDIERGRMSQNISKVDFFNNYILFVPKKIIFWLQNDCLEHIYVATNVGTNK